MIFKSQKGGLNSSDIMMYIAIALKHLRLMALLMCFSLLLGLTYYIYVRPVYYSQSLVRLSTFDRPMDRSAKTDTIFPESTDRVILKELRSPYMLERTAKKLGIQANVRDIREKYIKRVDVQLNSQKNILIDVWPYSYALARDWGKTMVSEYLLYRDEKRMEKRDAIIKTFAQEREEMKQIIDKNLDLKFDLQTTNELTKVQIELKRLKEVPRDIFIVKQRLALMDGVREAIQATNRDAVAKLSLLSSVSTDLDNSRMRDLSIGVGQIVPWQNEANGASSGVVVVPQNIVSSTKPWEALDKEHRRIEMELREKGEKFKDGHPQMIALQKQLAAVDKGLDLEFESALNSFNLEYANLQDRLGQLEKKLPEYHEVSRKNEKMLKDFNYYDAEQLNWNRMAGEMGKRIEALDFWSDKERAELQFIDNIEIDDEPLSPNLKKILVYSILLGLALAIAVPFLIEYLDGTVSDVDHIEETLKIRGLGVVPKINESSVDNLVLVSDTAKPDYQLQENFRVIRTNLIMSSETPNFPQIILVTSAMPQEGKTVVSSNLAMSFAVKGERTLLIDADLRRGRLHRLFGCQNKPGLSDILREARPVEEAMRSSGHQNLTIMTCGRHLNAASELLDTPVFAKLLQDLRQKYERIIVDTPPVLGLAETSIIQRMVDGVLLVIWSEFTPMRSVKSAIQSLQNNGAKFAGFVLNRLDFDALGNRYKYFYYAPNYYSNYKTIEAPVSDVTQ
jgi:capsular exopolysaccharide synthesis family protein